MELADTFSGPRDGKPCRLLDMQDCAPPRWREVNHLVAQAESLLQPWWFRPLLKFSWVRQQLGYSHWSRVWEYPWAIVNAELQPGMRLLDAGSGGSVFPAYLGLQGLNAHATDPSLDDKGEANLDDWRKMVLRATGFIFAWGLSSMASRQRVPVSYASDPIQQLHYDTGFFDRVFCLSVMEHIPIDEWSSSMEQLARVLCPHGRLLLTLDMTSPQADRRHYQHLCRERELQLLNEVDYVTPISVESKQRRHAGYTYEVLGLVWEKRG